MHNLSIYSQCQQWHHLSMFPPQDYRQNNDERAPAPSARAFRSFADSVQFFHLSIREYLQSLVARLDLAILFLLLQLLHVLLYSSAPTHEMHREANIAPEQKLKNSIDIQEELSFDLLGELAKLG